MMYVFDVFFQVKYDDTIRFIIKPTISCARSKKLQQKSKGFVEAGVTSLSLSENGFLDSHL